MVSGNSFLRKVSAETGVKVVAGTAAAVILGVLAYFYQSVGKFVTECWNILLQPVEVARWWLIVLWIVLILSVVRVVAGRASRARQKEPDWRELYTEDVIFDVLWRWSNSTPGKIVNLIPYCPYCKRLLRYHREADATGYPHGDVVVACQGCNFRQVSRHDPDEFEKRVHIEIMHRIDTGLWAKRALDALKKRTA